MRPHPLHERRLHRSQARQALTSPRLSVSRLQPPSPDRSILRFCHAMTSRAFPNRHQPIGLLAGQPARPIRRHARNLRQRAAFHLIGHAVRSGRNHRVCPRNTTHLRKPLLPARRYAHRIFITRYEGPARCRRPRRHRSGRPGTIPPVAQQLPLDQRRQSTALRRCRRRQLRIQHARERIAARPVEHATLRHRIAHALEQLPHEERLELLRHLPDGFPVLRTGMPQTIQTACVIRQPRHRRIHPRCR